MAPSNAQQRIQTCLLLMLICSMSSAFANECRLGFAPQKLQGITLKQGEEQPLNVVGVLSVKNLGNQPVQIQLTRTHQARTLDLMPGQREPADANYSLPPGTKLLSVRCMAHTPFDLLPLSGGPPELHTVFRIDSDTTRSAVVGGNPNAPRLAPFYRVEPQRLCQGMPAPGNFKAGPGRSAPRTLQLADYHWGVAALGSRPDRPLVIRLSGPNRAAQDIQVLPTQFTEVAPGRFHAEFRSPRTNRTVRVFRLGQDQRNCWTPVNHGTGQNRTINDRALLVTVDVHNVLRESREDNNQRPYGGMR